MLGPTGSRPSVWGIFLPPIHPDGLRPTRLSLAVGEGGGLDEVKKIESLLQPGEKVLVVARQSRWKSGGKLVNPGTVFATDRRLIIRDPYTLGLRAEITIIPYDKISGVRVKQGLLSTSLEFTAPGLEGGRSTVVKWGEGGVGEIDAIPADKARAIASIISGYFRGPAAQAGGGIVDQLAKLAELREKGVLTQEEYEKLKKRLIDEQK